MPAPWLLGAVLLCTAFLNLITPTAPSIAQTVSAGPPIPVPRPEGLQLQAQLAQALRAAAQDRWRDAASLARGSNDPLAMQLVEWLYLTDSNTRPDWADLRAFAIARQDWPRARMIQEKLELMLPDEANPAEILALFTDRRPISSSGLVRFARALAAERPTEANQIIPRLWIRTDFTRGDEAVFLAEHGSRLTPEAHHARLDRLVWDGDDSAIARMRSLVGAEVWQWAQARLLLARQASGVDQAIRAVAPALRYSPELLYERVRWRRRQDLTAGAIALLAEQPADPPQLSRWWHERHVLARRVMAKNDYQAAYALVSPHGQRQGVGFAQAEWLAGWLALRQMAQPQQAYRHFSSLYRGVSRPISLARGAYWTGRAVEALGEELIAGQWYHQAARHPTTFYGQLAMITLDSDQALRLPVEPSISAAARAQFDKRTSVQTARMLASLGERALAGEFVRRLGHLAVDGDDYRLVSQLALDIGAPDIAVELSRQSIGDRVNLVRSGYPVLPYAIHPDVEPALAHAVIRQESSFRPAAVSRSNARGLMQLLPSTARDVARRLGVQYPGDYGLLTDPATNVLLGSAYLGHLLERFDGSYVLAVVAYNAGPTRLSRWLRTHGDPRDPAVDPIDWIEGLPLYEPRNYVQRVLEGLQVYRNLYGNTHGETVSRLLNDLSTRGGASYPACPNPSCVKHPPATGQRSQAPAVQPADTSDWRHRQMDQAPLAPEHP